MKPTTQSAPPGTFLMLGSVFLFSANTLLLRAASLHAPTASGWTSLLYRGAVGLALVFALYGFGRGLSPRAFFRSKLVVLRGLLGLFSTAAFYLSIPHLGAARSVVLGLTYPIFATLIAAWWLKERLSRSAFGWMLAGFAGLVLFAGGDVSRPPTAWDAIALAGSVGAGFVVVLIRKLGHREHAGTIYGSLCLCCVLAALPMSARETTHVPVTGHAILLTGAIIVGISQLLMTNAYRTMPVSRGTSIQMLMPVLTGAGAWWFFHERFTAIELAGAALTLASTWRITRQPRETIAVATPSRNQANEIPEA